MPDEIAADPEVATDRLADTVPVERPGQQARTARARSLVATLSPREIEILATMAEGKSNAGVAAAVSLSERAVEKHINSIFTKLGLVDAKDVNRRVSAVLVFLAEAAH